MRKHAAPVLALGLTLWLAAGTGRASPERDPRLVGTWKSELLIQGKGCPSRKVTTVTRHANGDAIQRDVLVKYGGQQVTEDRGRWATKSDVLYYGPTDAELPLSSPDESNLRYKVVGHDTLTMYFPPMIHQNGCVFSNDFTERRIPAP